MIATKIKRCASSYDNKLSFATKKGKNYSQRIYAKEYADGRTTNIPYPQENMNRDNKLGEITHVDLTATELEMITLITQPHLLCNGRRCLKC